MASPDQAWGAGWTTDGTPVPGNDSHGGIPPQERAYIHVLRALGLSYDEIVDIVDRHATSVGRPLRETRERVRDGEDPVDVFDDVLAPLFDAPPEGDG